MIRFFKRKMPFPYTEDIPPYYDEEDVQPLEPQKRFPRLCLALYIFAIISTVLYLLFRTNSAFADWFNQTISSVLRCVTATVSMIVPFSLAEMLIILIPATAIALIVVAYKKYCDSWRSVLRFLGILLSIVCLVWSLFVWTFAPGYSAPSLDKKLELERKKVSAEQLYATAQILNAELHMLTDQITFLSDGSSLMPYSYADMNQKLLDAYDSYCEKHDYVSNFHSAVKPIMLSEPMSYSHITGVYTFFTGEANINVNFPDYTIPYTAAHELAHQRGIAREDEANFVAFLVCMESDDPYIRYSAYLNLYEYVLSALSSADRELYRQSYSQLPKQVMLEENAYSKFYDKYRKNVVADVSNSVNNAYLQSQGEQEGTKSYNLVVDLAVSYYRSLGMVK